MPPSPTTWETAVADKKWNTPYLAIGDEACAVSGAVECRIARLDRSIDPYIAAVIVDGRIVKTGLFSTMSSARGFCEQRK